MTDGPLPELDAEAAIRRVMVAYMQACDEHTPAAVAQLFSENARWSSMRPGASPPLEGREAIHETYAFDTTRLTFCVHYLTNEQIAVEGDRATARYAYFEPAVNRGTLAVWTAGRYELDLVREFEGWFEDVGGTPLKVDLDVRG